MENGSPSDVLKKAQLNMIGKPRCQADLKGYMVTDDMICAGDADQDACAGDSGGPLTCEDAVSGQKFICGITSWGETCQDKIKLNHVSPGVYTDVRKYHGWIVKHMEQAVLGKFRTNCSVSCVSKDLKQFSMLQNALRCTTKP